MKKNCINKMALAGLLAFASACSTNTPPSASHTVHEHDVIDSAEQMSLLTASEIVSSMATIQPEKGLKVFPVHVTGSITYDTRNKTSVSSRMSGRLEHVYIKYNYQPVRKGQLLLEIYSPELAAAQRELLLLKKPGQQSLMQTAIRKLAYLGMPSSLIQEVLKTEKIRYRIPVYSPASGYILEQNAATNTPVLLRVGQYVNAGQSLFFIYTQRGLVAEFAFSPTLASKIHVGKKIIFQDIYQPNTWYQGTLDLIQPTFNAGKNFSTARVYLNGNKWSVGQLIKGTLAISEQEGFWLPKEAIVQLGNQSVVFKKEQDSFKPMRVKTGISTDHQIQIIDSIAHWEVAKNAAFLSDSEDFITLNGSSHE